MIRRRMCPKPQIGIPIDADLETFIKGHRSKGPSNMYIRRERLPVKRRDSHDFCKTDWIDGEQLRRIQLQRRIQADLRRGFPYERSRDGPRILQFKAAGQLIRKPAARSSGAAGPTPT